DYGGSGDEVVGAVDLDELDDGTADFLTDGSAFSYFDAGGTAHYGYGIGVPSATGIPSTEWGGSPRYSILYDVADRRITVDYGGLTPGGRYRLLVTYLNRDSGGSTQAMTDLNGRTIHPPLGVTNSAPVQYAFPVPRSSVADGGLRVIIQALTGQRAAVAALMLVEVPSTDTTPPVVRLDGLADGALLRGTTVPVTGTASDADQPLPRVEIGIAPQGGETAWAPVHRIEPTGAWTFDWKPSDGVYTVVARAIDRAGNESTTASVEVVVDNTPPAPPTGFTVQEVAGALRSLWILSADDGAGASDVAAYEVYRGENPLGPFSLVGTVPAGADRFDDTTVVLGQEYHYYVRAVDQAGNGAATAVLGPVAATGAVDTTPPEDVTNLTAQPTHVDGATPSVFLRWTASANSEGDLTDQLLYVSADGGTTWGSNAPAFDDGRPLRLGRLRTWYQMVGLALNVPYRFRLTVTDEVPNESPGVEVEAQVTGDPSEVVTLGGTLPASMELLRGVYRVTSNLTVPKGRVLVLGTGTILKFDPGRGLDVYGDLVTRGTPSEPVVLTSLTDDDHGGDTNADGPSQGSPGQWGGLRFRSTSDAGVSRLQGALVRYAGAWGQAVYLETVSVPVLDTVVEWSSTRGIHSYNASPEIRGCVIRNNATEGVFAYYGAPVIEDSEIAGNRHGIYAQYSAPAVNDNRITDNAGYGVFHYDARGAPPMRGNVVTGNDVSLAVPMSAFPDPSNVLTPNTKAFIVIRGNTLAADTVIPVWAPGTVDEVRTYIVTHNDVGVPATASLTVEPGVILKFSTDCGIWVNGSLAAEGTLAEPVVFTSWRDDTWGGDTNGDGGASVPLKGDWDGIQFNASFYADHSVLDRVIVRYAGRGYSGGVVMNGAGVRVENSEISHSSRHGLLVYGASGLVRGNRIWANAWDGLYLARGANVTATFNEFALNGSDGIEVQGNAVGGVFTNNRIFLNRGFGIRNNASVEVDARQTWWGDVDGTGPYHADTNPDGTGQRVTDNVLFDPWVADTPLDYVYTNFSDGAPTERGSLPQPTVVQGTLSDEWDPTNRSPGRTMAYDKNAVEIAYTGLDPAARYRLYVTYFNADPGGSLQSLTDGAGNPLHGSLRMPSQPSQYGFSLPQAYYADGNLTLRFVHENPQSSLRASVSEVWIVEETGEIAPPLFDRVAYNDVDGSGDYSVGDELWFSFTQPLDPSLIQDGATDANLRLPPDTGGSYGDVNAVRWTADQRTVVVTLTSGFTVSGGETVTPSGLTDATGQAAIGSQTLPSADAIAPTFVGLDWGDADGDGAVSVGDRYVFRFSEAMDTSTIRDGTADANVHLRPEGGTRYGVVVPAQWSADARSLTVTVSTGFTVVGNELVLPSSLVRDVAGNPVTGTQRLKGRDTEPPTIVAVRFDDADGSGTVTPGDRYVFVFSEPMRTSALSDGTTEANWNLPPAARKYGAVNRVEWNADATEVTVWISQGYTVQGGENVDPTDLVTDVAGNPVAGTATLPLPDTDTVPPRVAAVEANYLSPVNAVDTYRLTVRFDSAMDPAAEPVLTITGTGASAPAVPPGGTWSTTFHPNDTYTTPFIALSGGMDGEWTVAVSAARDHAGNPMEPAPDAYRFTVDATAPPNPDVSVDSVGCDRAALSWGGYAPPADLAGFQLYVRTDGAFTTVDGRSFAKLLPASARSAELTSLGLEVPYEVAVAAFDRVGNVNTAVSSVGILIDEPVPPPVTVDVRAGADPDTAVVSWAGYDTTGLCGLAGFRVYRAETEFSSVAGMTPVADLPPDSRGYEATGLDRTRTYHFAVVAYNTSGEQDDAVSTGSWSDPYSGVITRNTAIGGGASSEIEIVQPLVVDGGAVLTIEPGTTLYFAPGAGLEVRNGRIVAEGTPFEPIVLTSGAARPGGTPQAGDWEGVVLGGGDTGSVLRNVFLEYGKGLQVRGASPTVEAFTAENNSGAGLLVVENGSLAAAAALLRYNDVGAEVATSGSLTLTGSVLKNNGVNARSDGTGAFTAEANWWGSPDPAVIGASIQGPVAWDPYLDHEPVLTPALATADGQTRVGTRTVDLALACRNAEAVRLSEDSTFPAAFFEPFRTLIPFELSPLGGEKTIFAQFKSPTGAVSDPVPLTLTYVTEGPEIQAFSLTEGQEVGRPLEVTGSATAALGIAALEFHVDGAVVASTDTGALALRWDVRDLTSGVHRVRLLARDTAGNESAVERNVLIQLVPPPAPEITSPADGLVVTGGTVDLRGTAEPLAPVRVSRDGFVVGDGTADETGAFAFTGIALREGSNRFVAVSEDSVGRSADSAPVTVVLDSAPPDAPELLSAEPQTGRGVLLSWKWAETGEVPDRYRIYRSGSPFADPVSATLVADAVRATDYLDENTPDGTWYYGVVAVDAAGNAGPVSNLIPVAYDGTPPAFAVSYDPEPPVGVGILGITLTTSEPLRGLPSLVIRPHGSRSPASVVLARVDETTYTGTFEITSGTPTGTAQVTVSGADPAGNGFSGEPSGPALVIDTDGPVGMVTVGVSEPVQVLDPRSVPVSLVLDEPVRPGSVPVLRYDPPVGDPVTVPLAGSGSAWAGQLALDPSMGKGVGRFTLSCEDALGNPGTHIQAGQTLEIYNQAVPDPAPPPSGLSTRALPGGGVRLSWNASDGATGYVVLRSAGSCSAPPSDRIAEGLDTTSHVDVPPADGLYCYAVASERLGAESDPSAAVPGLSDRTPPPPPQNVRISLGARGVRVAWDAPVGGEAPASYAVYRNGVRVRTLGANEPELAVADHPGVGGTYTYVVASVDAVGNEAPSGPAVFDLTVGAVADLAVFVEEGTPPVLTWTSTDPGAVGFRVYRGGVLLTPTPVTDTTFQDNGYSGASAVVYDVRAVNAAGEESPARTVVVHPIHLDLVTNPDDQGDPRPLVGRYLNVLSISAENRDGAVPFGPARLEVRTTVEGDEEYQTVLDLSDPIGAGEVHTEAVVVPVGEAAGDRIARIRVVYQGPTGESVTYQRSFALGRAEDPGVMVELSVGDVPLAGGYSTVQVCLHNRGYADLDVVVARGSGADPGDLFVAVRDAEGLELSKAYFRGFPPPRCPAPMRSSASLRATRCARTCRSSSPRRSSPAPPSPSWAVWSRPATGAARPCRTRSRAPWTRASRSRSTTAPHRPTRICTPTARPW
ncbi:MAG: hypothetical protein GXP50_12340, partial [Deltaproteobacteria bacterium]|nr:hypothetical protein [Deltaproteobacteria bacterium]